jgi:DNA-binding NtrC family response regulator
MGRLPNRRKQVLQALDQAVQPIYLLDEARRIVYCNPACLSWLHSSDEQVLGQRVDYHAGLIDSPLPWGGLCPPPRVFGGQDAEGSVWIAPDRSTVIHHRARFVRLSMASDAPAAVLVTVVGQAEPQTAVAAEPSKDAARLHEQLVRYSAENAAAQRIDPLVGSSAAIRQARAQVTLAIEHGDRVLLVGPDGSGREQVARSIHHAHAQGRPARLLPVDCALLDAELLRTTVEAFARRSVQAAHHGTATLLLLHAERLPLDAQERIWAWLDRPPFPLRVLATAADELAQVPGFHSELAAALSTLTIRLPALTARLQDLPLLVQSIVEQGNLQNVSQLEGVTPALLDRLLNHPWRGNLRELVDVLGSARARCEIGRLDIQHLPDVIGLTADAERFARIPPETIQLDNYLALIERELIERALRTAKGNRAGAARLLGISRARLLRRLESLGWDPADASDANSQ